jgi:hypothetical protein
MKNTSLTRSSNSARRSINRDEPHVTVDLTNTIRNPKEAAMFEKTTDPKATETTKSRTGQTTKTTTTTTTGKPKMASKPTATGRTTSPKKAKLAK